jgi:hypothetical protein
MSIRIMAGFLLAGAAMAVVVDRIAVTVDSDAITESEVIQDIRITDFLNDAPLDFSPAARRTAAERLVDQTLIRHEMSIGHYAQPQKSEAEQMLANFKKSHFASDAEFQAALKKYGITVDQLRSHLLWELSALRFTDVRFQPGMSASSPATVRRPEQHEAVLAGHEAHRKQNGESRERMNPRSGTKSSANPTQPAATIDEQLNAWLKEVRGQSRIDFKKGAFE